MTITLAAFEVGETVGTTEHSFTTDTAGPDLKTDAGIFQGFFDLTNLAAGDVFILRVYEKIVTAGSQKLLWKATLSGAQNEPGYVTPTLILGIGWDFTLQKAAGTDRLIQGRIAQVA
jgi:hypothetical protein